MPYLPFTFFLNINFPTIYFNMTHKKLQISPVNSFGTSLLSCFNRCRDHLQLPSRRMFSFVLQIKTLSLSNQEIFRTLNAHRYFLCL